MDQLTMIKISTSKGIFIDTGAFIAIIVKNDINHVKANEYWNKILENNIPIITSNFVISETYTWLRYKTSHFEATKFLDIISNAIKHNYIEVLYSDEYIEGRAINILVKYNDQDISYVDSVSFSIMENKDIKIAFTFDNHFRMMNFNILTDY